MSNWASSPQVLFVISKYLSDGKEKGDHPDQTTTELKSRLLSGQELLTQPLPYPRVEITAAAELRGLVGMGTVYFLCPAAPVS